MTRLTDSSLIDTSVSSKAVVSDSPLWIGEYPGKAKAFVTLTDDHGPHLIFHGDCGGRPQFLRDDRVLTATCKTARILDTQGNIIKTIVHRDPVSFAGVSQDGKRFALQVARFSFGHSISHETFMVYSVDTGEPIAEVAPDSVADEQSWTSFSPARPADDRRRLAAKAYIVPPSVTQEAWRMGIAPDQRRSVE